MKWASVGCQNPATTVAWLVLPAAESGRGLYRKRYVLGVWVSAAGAGSIYFSIFVAYFHSWVYSFRVR